MSSTTTTEKLLETRATSHGDYTDNAKNTQATIRVWEDAPNWPHLDDHQKETLHMIAHKVSRILCGDPNFADHWDDIAGYAKLSSERCEQ